MFRKVRTWLTDKGDQFVRGGGEPQDMQAEAAYDYEGEAENRQVIDPFNDGDLKYGGRVPYRSRAELEAEAYQAQLQAQQEAQAQQQAQYQQEQMQQTAAYQQGYQQQYQQEQMQQTGTYQPGYQQQYQQEQMQQTGTYQPGYQQQYQQEQPQQANYQQANYQQGYQQPQYQQEQPQQANYQQGYQQPQYQQEQPQQGGNVVTFPGMQTGPDGMVYAHVEYIVQIDQRNQCRQVIDYIRSNASVFVNMEAIVDPRERQRCVDMLSGAAYALGCALNKISPQGAYLISAASVRVIMDNATQKLASNTAARSFARQSYQAPNQQAYRAQQPAAQEEPEEPMQNGGFSSGSPTQRFQSQGAQGMAVSFGTAMAGSHTGMHRAINAQRYNSK